MIKDYAKQDRARLIAQTVDWRTQAENLADRVLYLERKLADASACHEGMKASAFRLQEANERAINWLDLGAPSRAREALLEATRQ